MRKSLSAGARSNQGQTSSSPDPGNGCPLRRLAVITVALVANPDPSATRSSARIARLWRIGQHQQDCIDSAVALTLADTSHDGLNIANPRLDLDTDDLRANPEEQIPGPSIARVRQRHLGNDANALSQQAPKPTDDGLVTLVADRIARSMKVRRQLEPKEGSKRGEFDHGSSVDVDKPLESGNVRLRRAQQPRD